MEQLKPPIELPIPLPIELALGWISLREIRIQDWWVDFGTPYELPRFGAEILGSDF